MRVNWRPILAMIVGVCICGGAEAITHWWENPVLVKTVPLGTTGQSPVAMWGSAAGSRLLVTTSDAANAPAIVFKENLLARRNGGEAKYQTSTANVVDKFGLVALSANVADFSPDLATIASSLSSAGIGQVQVTADASGVAYLNVFCKDGKVGVYALAADRVTLANPTPIATVDLAASVLDMNIVDLASVAATPDGLALFVAPPAAEGIANNLYVVRSDNWGLVDAAAWKELFPWRIDHSQLSTHQEASLTLKSRDAAVCWADPSIYSRISWTTAATLADTFSGLTAGDAYQVEYHYAENCYTKAGVRVSDITINDVKVATNFDFVVEAGGPGIACVRKYDTTAKANGQIVFTFSKVIENPIVSGVAIWGREAPSNFKLWSTFNAAGTSGSFSWQVTDALACYVQSAPTREGPWTTVLRDQTAKKYTATCAADTRTFYRVVASNGVGTVTSTVVANRPEKFPVYSLNCGFEMERVGRFVPESHHVPGAHTVFNPDIRFRGVTLVPANDNPDDIPSAVCQTATREHFGFLFPNLRPGKTYDLRLFLNAYWYNAPITVAANGTTLATNISAPNLVNGDGLQVPEVVFPALTPTAEGVIRVDLPNRGVGQLSAIELVENDSDRVPLVPVVQVFARHNGNHISIKPGTGDLTYEIRRRPASGGDYETVVTGTTSFGWFDVGAAADTVYSVRATNAEGKFSDWTADIAVAATTPERFVGLSPQRNLTIKGELGNYNPYIEYTGARGTVNEWDKHIYRHDVVLNPAPDAIYKLIMYFNNGYFTVTNLYPNATYRVRVHSLESAYADINKRVWERVTANEHDEINGVLDPYREVGKGVFVTEGLVRSSPDGWISLFFRASKDNIDMATAEFILEEGDRGAVGVATAARTGADGAWQRGTAANLELSAADAVGARHLWETLLQVPVDGEYTFAVTQNGAYALWIDDANVLRPSGGAAASAKVTLKAGAHRLRAQFVAEQAGTSSVALTWAGANFAAQTLATPSLTLPKQTDIAQENWFSTDSGSKIPGDFYRVGTAQDGSDVWRLSASGLNHFKADDEGHFVYRKVAGARDFDAMVRVRRFYNPKTWSIFGLQIRANPEAKQGSYSWMSSLQCFNPPYTEWRLAFAGDDYTDGVNIGYTYQNYNAQQHLPIWLKVEYRTGGAAGRTAKFYCSTDDCATWTVLGEKTLPRIPEVYVGMLHVADTNDYLTSVDIDNFSLTVYPPAGTMIILR